jgi:putative ATPase
LDLFNTEIEKTQTSKQKSAPLAERLRPKTLNDFVGQKHLVRPGKPIRQMIKK